MDRLESKVVVVDDDASVLKALARLLKSAGMQVATYASAEDYLQAYDPSEPGCLVLDLAMPSLGGLELQDELARRSPLSPPIIFLTGRATVTDSVRAFKHGATEFLTKPVDEEALLGAVRGACEKDKLERTRFAEQEKTKQLLATLTPREVEVFRQVVVGKLNKQIAYDLGTVEKTVKVHRARVMEKMHVNSLAELVLVAVDAGIAGHRAH